ncbi:hypothetical protein Pint_27364 [Pistacia integerrima]|uniref:Uncharacterized protein n=2 Tax=Pistacia TaxID=55512 RepID=A0ACC1BE19_9ROSI|nr:hypothetical protein Pint_27364 [Pistacia integerrima]KAJ0097096.1 hypothetical protein Patl1_27970 [Pistacia atlantica]
MYVMSPFMAPDCTTLSRFDSREHNPDNVRIPGSDASESWRIIITIPFKIL